MQHLKGFKLFESKKIDAIRQFIPEEKYVINNDLNPTVNQRPTTREKFDKNLLEFKENLKKSTE